MNLKIWYQTHYSNNVRLADGRANILTPNQRRDLDLIGGDLVEKMNSSTSDGSPSEADTGFHQELERRFSILAPEGRDFAPLGSFTKVDYILMVVFGLVVPVLAMFWGWE